MKYRNLIEENWGEICRFIVCKENTVFVKYNEKKITIEPNKRHVEYEMLNLHLNGVVRFELDEEDIEQVVILEDRIKLYFRISEDEVAYLYAIIQREDESNGGGETIREESSTVD